MTRHESQTPSLASRLLAGGVRGAAAGVLGTNALNAVTYGDMVLRGRPPSTAPEETVRKALEAIGLEVPGDAHTRLNRLSGLGALGGMVTGAGLGAALGVLRVLGFRPGRVAGSLVAAAIAMVGANTPLAALRVSDPREWTVQDWLADVLPHLAYGVVTHAAMASADRNAA